jgi:hypothetical protein
MSERLRALSDYELGRVLAEVGRDLDTPPTPPILPGVRERLRDMEQRPAMLRPRLSLPSRRRTLVLVLAALLLVAFAALATTLVLRLGAVRIEIVPSASSTVPTSVETSAAFGERVTFAEAEEKAGFPAVVPTELGAPDRLWVGEAPVGFDPAIVSRRIVMAWDPRADLPTIPGLPWGAILMEFPGDAEIVAKTVSADTGTLANVLVDGRAAAWITGVHTMEIATSTGPRVLRVTGNVLVWQRGTQTLRLETNVSVDRAVAIAESTD